MPAISIVISTNRPNQTRYLRNVQTHDLTFGIGPAGTGKTYLAVASAVEAAGSDLVAASDRGRRHAVDCANMAGTRWRVGWRCYTPCVPEPSKKEQKKIAAAERAEKKRLEKEARKNVPNAVH